MPVNKMNTFNLSALLSPAQIYIVPPGQTKQAVIRRLVEQICQAEPALGPEEILREVLRREEGISTTLDTGLSIPHARLEEIAGPGQSAPRHQSDVFVFIPVQAGVFPAAFANFSRVGPNFQAGIYGRTGPTPNAARRFGAF